MMPYNNPQDMTLIGVKTPQTVVFKSESHKLHQAFVVKKDAVIVQGMPVQLETDGSISPYLGEGVYLGVAMTDSVFPAYPGNEVTVAVEGFCIVYGVSSAALEAGYVVPEALPEKSMYVPYAASSDATAFIALNATEGEDELVQILVK